MIASEAGYRSLGWPEGGRIAEGALADFVVVRADSVRTAGARPDQIVFAAHRRRRRPGRGRRPGDRPATGSIGLVHRPGCSARLLISWRTP